MFLGAHNTGSTGSAIEIDPVQSKIEHPNYNSVTNDNDFALLILPSDQYPFEATFNVACLPMDNNEDYTDKTMTVTGWGDTTQGGSTSAILQEVDVDGISNAVCNTLSAYSGQITSNMICAGVPGGGKDSCQGDSGGTNLYQ